MSEAELHYELAEARLDNGLQVVVSPDRDAPGVAVNLWVEVGSADAPAGGAAGSGARRPNLEPASAPARDGNPAACPMPQM